MRRLDWRSAGMGALALAVLAFLIVLFVVLTGSYNVAADERHTPLVGWATSTTMRNSVQSRASDLKAPAFTPAMIVKGGGEYKAMCQHCHGGVGTEREEWAQGMLPKPPALAGAAKEWTPEEVFWLVKHGVKMSGMPAFGGHDDQTIWTIAAFVKAMPTMSAAQYEAVPSEKGGHGGKGSEGHGHAE